MGQDQSGQCGGGQDVGHDKRQMGRDPYGGADPMSSDRVNMDTEVVYFEVDPVKAKCLQEAQDALAEEGVDTHLGTGLEENCQDTVAED